MDFKQAENVVLAFASDNELVEAWHAYAARISFHHADDSGREWKVAGPLMERARQIEQTIRLRRLPRPSGAHYLLSEDSRIDWETGEWEPGWCWKKAQRAAEAKG